MKSSLKSEQLQNEIRDLLRDLLIKIPESESFDAEGINTGQFIADLAKKWPTVLSRTEESGLDALCRKVDVVKKIMQAYSFDWKTSAIKKPLSEPGWFLLAGVLLAYGRNTSFDIAEHKGRALKWINTSYKILDRCGSKVDRDASTPLESLINEVMENILNN